MTATSTDYVGNLILKNGHPEMLRLDDGYVSFDSDTISGIHYYIQDYMGNNRMVVNGRTDSIEQVTHYYPYGGVIGDISTNESLQKFKFEDKELDRTFGLDNYDIHARQYFAMAPMWDRPDKLAYKFYHLSPYVYCGGDPVNHKDENGQNPILIGAGIGFLVGAGIEIWNQRNDESFDGQKMLAKGISGALTGAIASTGYGFMAKIGQGIGSAFVGNVIDQCIDNKSVDLSQVDTKDVIMSSAIGYVSSLTTAKSQEIIGTVGSSIKAEIKTGINQRTPNSPAVKLVQEAHPTINTKQAKKIVKKMRQDSVREVDKIINSAKDDISNDISISGSIFTNIINEDMNKKASYGNF